MTHCGYIGLIGRPNVGKSTLLNKILGKKLSITADKPQTTRHRILGIKTIDDSQAVYVDTPGMHRNVQRTMNRIINKAASNVLAEVDVIVFVVDGTRWTEEDEWILARLTELKKPVILALNKIDKIADRGILLPHMKVLSEKFPFTAIIPISAQKGANVDALEKVITDLLPENPHFFESDQRTDRNDRFLAAEMIREKLIRLTGDELPYSTTVEIEAYVEEEKIIKISAVIWVERPGQKAIVIGKGGEHLKMIGQSARLDMEKAFDNKVFLQLWVKVRKGWADDERALQKFGITE